MKFTLNKKKYNRNDTNAVVTFSNEDGSIVLDRNVYIPRKDDGSVDKTRLSKECERISEVFDKRISDGILTVESVRKKPAPKRPSLNDPQNVGKPKRPPQFERNN